MTLNELKKLAEAAQQTDEVSQSWDYVHATSPATVLKLLEMIAVYVKYFSVIRDGDETLNDAHVHANMALQEGRKIERSLAKSSQGCWIHG